VSEHRKLVWVDTNDEISIGNVDGLASHIEAASLASDGDVVSVFTFTAGEAVKLTWEVTGTAYDEDAWARSTVTVAFPDGTREESSWKVDGAV
jgi:hypothetical protein